jgi:ribosome biogenesis protein MAK21
LEVCISRTMAQSATQKAEKVPSISLDKLADKVTKFTGENKSNKREKAKTSKKAGKKAGKLPSSKIDDDVEDGPADDNMFLKEVEELGGSKDDLDLISGDLGDSGAESEIEINETRPVDGGLVNDVDSYLAGLGFNRDTTNNKEKDVKKDNKKSVKKDDRNDVKKKDDKKKEEKSKSKGDKVKEATKREAKVEDGKIKKKTDEKLENGPAEVKDRSKYEKTKNNRQHSTNRSSLPVETLDISRFKKLQHGDELVLEPRNDWFNPDLEAEIPTGSLSESSVDRLFEIAKELLKRENELYVHESAKSGSQKQFLSQLLTAGTLSDKISALSLLIQESPIHSVKYFDIMLGLCRKKSRGSAMQAVAALKDIFTGGVLLDRKLKWFKNQPVSNQTSAGWLIVWAFEDWLKQYFFSLLQILEVSNCNFLCLLAGW